MVLHPLQVTAADYLAAQPDPVAAFAVHVAGHMNGEDSHVQDMCDMVQHYVGLKVSAAKMLALDRLGTDLEVTRDGQTFKLRLPFIKCVLLSQRIGRSCESNGFCA